MNRLLLVGGALASLLLLAPPVAAQDAACKIPAAVKPFMDRVFAQIGGLKKTPYDFAAWSQAGRPTEEGVGLLTLSSTIDPEKVVRRVMDVEGYTTNLGHVSVSRSIADARYVRPSAVRFYELIALPMIGDLHFEAVLTDAGTCNGYRVATWHMLESETNALSREQGMRSDYNDGAWLATPTSIGYALSSAPIKDDTNWAQWQALTIGADATAGGVVEGNLEAMAKWVNKP